MLVLILMSNATGVFDNDHLVIDKILGCPSVEFGVDQTVEYFKSLVGDDGDDHTVREVEFDQFVESNEINKWTTDDVDQENVVHSTYLISGDDCCVGIIKKL